MKRLLALTLLVLPSTALADQPIDLGIFGGAHIFGGNGDVDRAHAIEDGPGVGLHVAWWLSKIVAAEGEFAWIPTNTKDGNTSLNAIGYRLSALVRFNTEAESFPFLNLGVGGFSTLSGNTAVMDGSTQFEIHAGLGYRLDLGSDWGLRIEGRAMAYPKVGLTPLDGEIWIGVSHFFGKEHQKPAPVVVDTDGDGIPDDQDKCPKEAGPAERQGCPVKDRDKDGIEDDQDKCPDEAGPAERQGCPVKDRDKDGIEDDKDKCPDEAGPAERQGCPVHDRDGDGIEDEKDKCPDQPETKNGYQDEDGCPDVVPQAVAKFTGAIKGITFESGSAKINKSSNGVLDEATKVLKDYATVKLEISGHTDDVGDHDMNQKLSQDRADAVKKYFTDKGIGDERLKAVGYGPDKPVDPAKTAAARAKNRRVEFQLLSQ